MSIFNVFRGQFIDIVEWTEPTQNDILAYRFPRANNEIKMGAKLVVREGQTALFVNEGQLTDIFLNPGTYTLTTENLPILSTLKGWKYGFNSPFKAEVYFISMRQWTDQKWGTQNPIMMRDPEFGPVRVRAFGSYAFHVADPATFLKQLVVTDPMFEAFEISNQLRNTIVSRFVDSLGTAKIAVLDLAGNYDKISKVALEVIKPDLAALGLSLTSFLIENISLPPEVEQALDQRTKMGVLGDLNKYTQFQTAQAIGDAAKNPNGMSGLGTGIAAGAAMADQMRNAMARGADAPVGSSGASTAPYSPGRHLLHCHQWPATRPLRRRHPRRQSPRGLTDPGYPDLEAGNGELVACRAGHGDFVCIRQRPPADTSLRPSWAQENEHERFRQRMDWVSTYCAACCTFRRNPRARFSKCWSWWIGFPTLGSEPQRPGDHQVWHGLYARFSGRSFVDHFRGGTNADSTGAENLFGPCLCNGHCFHTWPIATTIFDGCCIAKSELKEMPKS